MKAIMISIKPKWVAKILNGEKTIEIRKTCPAIFKHLHSYEGASLEVYIYCTKGNPIGKFGDGLYHEITKDSHWSNGCSWNMPKIYLEGKVVAKFTLNKIRTSDMTNCLQGSCLSYDEVNEYTKGKKFYGWVIDNLEIFDKPKELSEFRKCQLLWNCVPHNCQECPALVRLTKAPQSWCYVEELK